MLGPIILKLLQYDFQFTFYSEYFQKKHNGGNGGKHNGQVFYSMFSLRIITISIGRRIIHKITCNNYGKITCISI